MNILEFYKNLVVRKYRGITAVICKTDIDKNKIETILKKNYLNGCSAEFGFFVFDLGEKYDISVISSALSSYSFGCPENLVIFYSFDSLNSKEREKIVSYIEKSGKCNLFLFTKEKYKILGKFNIVEIVPVSKRPFDIKSIVRGMCKERKINLTTENLNTIVKLYGNNIERIDKILDQLELAGNDAVKDRDIFAKIIGEGTQISFYKMTKSFLDKDMENIRMDIDNLLSWGIHPVMFLSVLKKILLKVVAVYEGEDLKGDYLKDKYEKTVSGLNAIKIKKLFDLFYNMEYKSRVMGIDNELIDFYTMEMLKAI